MINRYCSTNNWLPVKRSLPYNFSSIHNRTLYRPYYGSPWSTAICHPVSSATSSSSDRKFLLSWINSRLFLLNFPEFGWSRLVCTLSDWFFNVDLPPDCKFILVSRPVTFAMWLRLGSLCDEALPSPEAPKASGGTPVISVWDTECAVFVRSVCDALSNLVPDSSLVIFNCGVRSGETSIKSILR